MLSLARAGATSLQPRLLGPGDEAALEALLARHADSSMFLRNNIRRAGLIDRGRIHEASYVGLDDGGELLAAAAHAWSGLVLLQAPIAADALAAAAVRASGRGVTGLLGPWDQILAAKPAVRLVAPPGFVSREVLMALALDELVLPPALATGRWICRRAGPKDEALTVEWSIAYQIEALNACPSPELAAGTRAYLGRLQAEGCQWLLEVDGRPAAYCAFNAVLPDRVQVGGVFTPPAWRGRGHARAVVAGALMAARDSGIDRAVLFTGEHNAAAQRAYRSLGFVEIGDYGVVLAG